MHLMASFNVSFSEMHLVASFNVFSSSVVAFFCLNLKSNLYVTRMIIMSFACFPP
ncbi:hypothetical protein SLEP1_g33446 [Rubroshorea leprosula]|uniref:NADH dehydrogenase subunit 4L n=1 Tax=Rubroshorea leprosula TaxID=152421 RepID=A0AAV5KGT1_9ROSI|nr:hypothetical protein SLEP1_g33446 [Rubroshorea leprosula]